MNPGLTLLDIVHCILSIPCEWTTWRMTAPPKPLVSLWLVHRVVRSPDNSIPAGDLAIKVWKDPANGMVLAYASSKFSWDKFARMRSSPLRDPLVKVCWTNFKVVPKEYTGLEVPWLMGHSEPRAARRADPPGLLVLARQQASCSSAEGAAMPAPGTAVAAGPGPPCAAVADPSLPEGSGV